MIKDRIKSVMNLGNKLLHGCKSFRCRKLLCHGRSIWHSELNSGSITENKNLSSYI